jgi:hypothetical protein
LHGGDRAENFGQILRANHQVVVSESLIVCRRSRRAGNQKKCW